MSDLSPESIDRTRAAISEGMGVPIVTRFVLIAETIDDDGEATVEFMSDCDLAWQTLGLLHHGLNVAKEDDE